MTDPKLSRRQLLAGSALGIGAYAWRSLATGLPLSFIMQPGKALAATTPSTCSPQRTPQYLIMSISGAGNPVGLNAPGTYPTAANPVVADIVHPPGDAFASKTFMMNGQSVAAAAAWSALPQAMLDRLAFFHHSTYTDVHTQFPAVMAGMGRVSKGEMLPSALSQSLAPCLGTIQAQPVNLTSGQLTYQGSSVPVLPPSSIASLLGGPNSPLASLGPLRDQTLDTIHAYLKQHGNKAQRAFLDSMAVARQQSASLGGSLLSAFTNIKDDGVDSQFAAAVALIRMKVAPVVVMEMQFGGDNHFDTNLAYEAGHQLSSIASLTTFWNNLTALSLQDQISFGLWDVFGRTFKGRGTAGRDHLAAHSMGLLMGPHVAGGVIGGIAPLYGQYAATPIDAATGAGAAGAGIATTDLLASYMATVSASVGVDSAQINNIVINGAQVTAALR